MRKKLPPSIRNLLNEPPADEPAESVALNEALEAEGKWQRVITVDKYDSGTWFAFECSGNGSASVLADDKTYNQAFREALAFLRGNYSHEKCKVEIRISYPE